VAEQVLELAERAGLAVDVVVGVDPLGVGGAALDAAGELDLVGVLGDRSVPVVQDEADLALVAGLAVGAAVVDEVGQAPGADRLAGGGPEHEEDRVGDVGLAGPVGARDPGEALLEGDFGVSERLEVLHLDALEVHRVTPRWRRTRTTGTPKRGRPRLVAGIPSARRMANVRT
jgi:hypothetical protein